MNALRAYLQDLDREKPVIYVETNVAHQEIDLKNQNQIDETPGLAMRSEQNIPFADAGLPIVLRSLSRP